MANEKTPVVWDDTTKKHRPLGTGEKMGGLDASSLLSSDSGNLLEAGSDGLAYLSGSGVVDPRADNLLEESDRGKLQVTVDRIAEWLDGHPQDAAVLADAINVVSGDSGNVIVEGTDKGAFLSKGAISSAVAGMTDAQKNAIADAIAARIAGDIADGKTIVASGGKLTADPTNATAAQKKAINQALADASSGLVVNNSTGRLQVDFSNMPTDKFEELLKSLKMLVPLSAPMNVWVDANSDGDTLVDGRGTQAKPFKHIQAAVNYVTGNYSLGNHNVNIRVVAGTYRENVTLPSYAAGTGAISIQSASGSRDVTIRAVENANGFVYSPILAMGGHWYLVHLTIERVEQAWTGDNIYVGCILECTGDSTVVDLCGVHLKQSFPSNANLPGVQYEIRLAYADAGATIALSPYDVGMALTFSDTASHARTVSVFSIARGAKLLMRRPIVTDAISGYSWNVACSGSCTVFTYVWQGSSMNAVGGGPALQFDGAGVTGKRYNVTGGSFIAGAGSATYFPGDVAGTVEDATYCWYA